MIDKSTSATLDRIFDEMYNLISAASRIPLTDKIIVEESDLAEILDDLKEAIPREVKSAAKLLEEQKAIINKAHEDADNIVVQAKTEAERIVEIARAEAERLLRQEEIVQQAQAFAEDIKATAMQDEQEVRAKADAYAERVKMDVLQYADDMLTDLSGRLQLAMHEINQNFDLINNERGKLTPAQPDEFFDAEAEETEEEK